MHSGITEKGSAKKCRVDCVISTWCSSSEYSQFISDSAWKYQSVMGQTAQNVNDLLGDNECAALLIDESGIPKKGKKSAGVGRQWPGSLEKTDNGKLAFFPR